jgi:hypothetical protein
MSQNQQEQSEAKLLAFIEGELDAAGRVEIEKHLEAHPQHRKLLEEMRGMRDWVRWLPRESAPAELSDSFQERLERTLLLGAPEASGVTPMRISRWPRIGAAAAVVALAIGVGGVVYFVLPPRRSPFAALPSAGPAPNMLTLTSKPTDASSNSDDAVQLDKQAQTREAQAMSNDERPAPETPTTGATDFAVARGPAADELRSTSPGGSTRPDITLQEAGALADTQPTVAEAQKKDLEPTEQLARIAQSTYGLVSADPALVGMLHNSGPDAVLAPPPSNATASSGATGPDLARLRKAAELSPAYRNHRPLVLVVLAADTDRAHKQIGDYLADLGITATVVNDGSGRQALDMTGAAKPQGQSAAVPQPALAGGVGAPAGSTDKPAQSAVIPPRPAASLTPGKRMTAAPVAGTAAPAVAAAPPPPQIAIAGGRPASSPPVAAPATFPAAPATATDAPIAPLPSAAAKAASPDATPWGEPDATARILLARGLTARQAQALQANLRQPTASQWAAVYREPSDDPNGLRQLGESTDLVPPPTGPTSLPLVVTPSNPPVVSASNPPAASPSTPAPANLSNPAPTISTRSLAMSTPAAPNGTSLNQHPALPARTAASPSNGQVASRDGVSSGERREAAHGLEKDARNPALKAAGSPQPGNGQEAGAARHADRSPVVAPTLAGPAPLPAASPMPGGSFGGGQEQSVHTIVRGAGDLPTPGSFNLPSLQTGQAQHQEQAAGVAGDDQPVDVVIVLQQSSALPAASSTQPAGK